MLTLFGLKSPITPFSTPKFNIYSASSPATQRIQRTERAITLIFLTTPFQFEKIDMEVALEMEDDLFFADLSKQLSLLLMDDNEFPVPQRHVSLQAFSHGVRPARPPPPFEHAYGAPSKGTGVFIPRSLRPARKQRRGRYNLKSNRQFPVLVDVNSGVSSDQSLRPKKD